MTAAIPKKPGALPIRFFARRSYRHAAHYERVLGTVLEFQCVTSTRQAGPRAEKAALAEIDRLQAIFNAYEPSSELNRWQDTRNEDVAVSRELAEVLGIAAMWTTRTGGAFHPAVEALTQIWAEHESSGSDVAVEDLQAVLAGLRQPSWQVDAGRGTARRLTPLRVTLNSIAKGYIIDKAAARAAASDGVGEVLVNIGGDLRHIGSKPVRIDIVNPFETADNAAPVGAVNVRDMGLATSGNYRRGFHINGRWHSHLLNPRTGRPVEQVVSASVLAPDAMTADVLATVFSILTPPESLRLADSLPRTGVLLVQSDGVQHTNDFWRFHLAPLSH